MASALHWVITKDLNTDPEHDKDLAGTHCSVGPERLTAGQIWTHRAGQEFRLVDGDFKPMFEGIYVGPEECLEEPLEGFGVHQDGCYAIQYRNEQGQWETI